MKSIIGVIVLVLVNAKAISAQTMTISETPISLQESVGVKLERPLVKHPSAKFLDEFATSCVMTGWWKDQHQKLDQPARQRLLDWMMAEAKEYDQRTQRAKQLLKSRYGEGLIKWLNNEIGLALVKSHIWAFKEELAKPDIVVPQINFWQAKLAELMCLKYLCQYKQRQANFDYDEGIFLTVGQPLPDEVMSSLTDQKPKGTVK